MTTTERDAKLDKARKLRRKAASTTSEAEAMACIAIVRKLQAECGLTLEEIEREDEFTSAAHFQTAEFYSGDNAWNHVDMNLAFVIAEFCRVKVGTKFKNNGVKNTEYFLQFFGHEADVENASWLRETIKAAMLFEWEIYRDFVMPKGSDQRVARRSFSMGMAGRLRQRMEEAKRDDDEESTALTIRVNALVEQRAKEAGFTEAKGARRTVRTHDAGAYASGQDAGSRVNIGRGVTHRADTSNHAASGPKQIGSK